MNAFRLLVLTFLLLGPAHAAEKATPFEQALEAAQKALEANKRDEAWSHIERALERDAQSLRAWQLRARWAEASKDKDEQVYCLHKILRLSIAQGEPKTRIDERRARLREIDPVADSFLNLKTRFRDRLLPFAKQYEKKKRRHALRRGDEVVSQGRRSRICPGPEQRRMDVQGGSRRKAGRRRGGEVAQEGG